MADENTTEGKSGESAEGAGQSSQTGNNTSGDAAGAGTQTAKTTTEADDKETKLYTEAEAKKRAEDLVAKTITKKVRAELIKRGIDPDAKEGETAKPNVQEWQQRAETAEGELRTYRAKDQLESFVSDKRNNAQVKNLRGLFKIVKDDLEFDDDGRVTNFKEVLAQAKSEAPELFGTAAGSADGGAGAQNNNGAFDMNTNIRQMAGR